MITWNPTALMKILDFSTPAVSTIKFTQNKYRMKRIKRQQFQFADSRQSIQKKYLVNTWIHMNMERLSPLLCTGYNLV